MQQMVDALEGRSPQDRSGWISRLRSQESARLAEMAREWDSNDTPINPLRLCREVDHFIDDNTIVIGDGGDIVGTGANVFRIRKPGQWMDPGPLGTLGVGAPYAMAAKLARPDARVVVLYGDGSFGLNGMEYEAAVRQNIPFVGVIGNDAAWMQIRRGQVAIYGEERAVATGLSYTRYDKMVEALGGHGEWVERPEDIRPALERAFASGKPALVNVKIGGSDFRKMAISV
jgi:acetolactate synthase-1/2/3 large subunit